MIDINSVLGDRKKTWSIAALLILCALAFILLFKYDYGNYRKIKLAASENKYNKATLDSLGKYEKYLKEFNTYLAPGNDIDRFMGILTVMSRNNGVVLSAVKPSETERSSGYDIVKVSIEGTSSYETLLRFIETIEDSKEYMFIDSISVKSIETGAGASAKNRLAGFTESAPSGRPIGFKAIIASVVEEI